MDLFGLGTLISGIGNMVTSGIQYSGNKKLAEKQFKAQQEQNAWQNQFAKEQFEYQKQQNLLTQQREDNAIQRRYADMEKAGINPLTAVGTGGASAQATSGSTMSGGQAGQTQQVTGLDNMFTGIMNAISQQQNIAQSKAQTKLIEQQTKTERENTANKSADTKNIEKQTNFIDKQSAKIDAEIDRIKKQNELDEIKKSTEKANQEYTKSKTDAQYWDNRLSKTSATKSHENTYKGNPLEMLQQGAGIGGNLLEQMFNWILNR